MRTIRHRMFPNEFFRGTSVTRLVEKHTYPKAVTFRQCSQSVVYPWIGVLLREYSLGCISPSAFRFT
jgi:hypothetical protein